MRIKRKVKRSVRRTIKRITTKHVVKVISGYLDRGGKYIEKLY